MALSANTDLKVSGGIMQRFPLLASEKPYQGSLIGRDTSGYVRTLVAGDRFVGINRQQVRDADKPAASGDVHIEVLTGEMIAHLPITSAAIADAQAHKRVYASDDGTFTFTRGSNTFIGHMVGLVSSGIAIVRLITDDVGDEALPAALQGRVWEDVAVDKTLDIEDVGKVINVTADAKTITLPATAAGLDFVIRNGGANAAQAVNVSPAAADKIMGADLAGVDDKDRINTKATAKHGDYIHLAHGGTDGYLVLAEQGTWAAEA